MREWSSEKTYKTCSGSPSSYVGGTGWEPKLFICRLGEFHVKESDVPGIKPHFGLSKGRDGMNAYSQRISLHLCNEGHHIQYKDYSKDGEHRLPSPVPDTHGSSGNVSYLFPLSCPIAASKYQRPLSNSKAWRPIAIQITLPIWAFLCYVALERNKIVQMKCVSFCLINCLALVTGVVQIFTHPVLTITKTEQVGRDEHVTPDRLMTWASRTPQVAFVKGDKLGWWQLIWDWKNHLSLLVCSLLPKGSHCLLVPVTLTFMPLWSKAIEERGKLNPNSSWTSELLNMRALPGGFTAAADAEAISWKIEARVLEKG